MRLSYCIHLQSPQAHLFELRLTITQPDPAGQIVWLPVWIPGSYLIREFARHIVSIRAINAAGEAIAITKLDKQRWQIAPSSGVLTVHYEVYAYDLSVRGAYFDQTRAFFNGPSVFLAVAGQENQPAQVEIIEPDFTKDWQVATSLSACKTSKRGFGVYEAANYDELIDHPVEIGDFARVTFKACGVPHEIVLAGRHQADLKHLKRDIKKICEYQIKLFGEPAPFDRYVFMTMAVGDGYGGLEHRASTALICNRDDLPLVHETGMKAGYRQYLGLVSHEYFHSWNVKRIKPAAYAPYDLTQENYTRLLWAFEGITSYYDDLTLVRTELISEQDYLDCLAQTLTQVERGSGSKKQNLEDASFDAWIKYYRQDENSPNALVSYYTKGALVALCLDLTIRRETRGAKSLDDVMRALWLRFGRNFASAGQGVAENEWERLASEVTGLDLSAFFKLTLRSTEPLPVAELLAWAGIETQLRPQKNSGDKGGWQDKVDSGNTLGVRTSSDGSFVKLTHVLDGGAAQAAGLSAGDLLVAMDGIKISSSNLDKLLAAQAVGARIEIHAFRRDELMVVTVHLQSATADTWGLRPNQASSARKTWLAGV